MDTIDLRHVEDLVYKRVRLEADLLELIELDRDLALSLRRKLVDQHGHGDDLDDVVERSLQRAWRRLADDLSLDLDEMPEECPLCQGDSTTRG